MMMERILPGAFLTIARPKYISVIFFIVCFESLVAVGNLRVSFWSHMATEDFATFQQVTVDRQTGDVFVAGVNTVAKFDSILRLQAQSKTGPTLDDSPCRPNDLDCNKKAMMDNHAKILEIHPSLNCLLFCGSTQHGLCSVFSLSDLTLRTMGPANPANYMGSRDTVYAFFDSRTRNVSSLYVANTYDGRPLHLSIKAISAMSLQQLPNSNFQLEPVASFDFESTSKSEYIVHYVYGFEHNGFVYFLTVQRESLVDEVSFETKLVRVCQNDSNFYSYTEVALSCRQKHSFATFLNVAQAAYLAPVGKDFSKRFGLPANEMALYVLMAKSRQQSWQPDPSYGSGICLYTLTDIRKAFTKAQQDCYLGYGRLLPWITYTEPRCSKNQTIAAQINDNFCGLLVNVGIGSRYPLSAETNFTMDDYLGTSLAVIFHQNKTVAIMGTSDGHLVKALIDGSHSTAYHVLDVGAGLDFRFPVASDMAFDLTQEHLYVLTGPRITRVPVRSCGVYEDCASCISTPDPLGCGWCDDHCSTKEHCMSTWTNEFCLPVIHLFSPRSGPVHGGTKVTIVGQNFGSGNRSTDGVSVSIKVAMVDCAVELHNNTRIVCVTGQSVRGPIEREVKVSIVDLSRTAVNFGIRGSVSTLQESFAYRVPSVVSVAPTMGPKSGGTQLTVYGQRLDIGSSQSVVTANCPCSIVRVTATSIVCTTSASTQNSSKFLSESSVVDRGPVSVYIDGALLNVNNSLFIYMDDPVITNVFPRISFLSGGIPITVTGSNLHIIQSPTIYVQMPSELFPFSSHCYPNQNGSSMICRSPNITLSKRTVLDELPVEGKLYFDMDQLREFLRFDQSHPHLSTISYFLDPVFFAFSGNRGIRQFFDDENYLDVQGKFLNLAADESDYRVLIGGTDCYVTQLTATTLLCRPKKPEAINTMESYKAVQVHVGNLLFSVGSLQYAKRNDNTLVIITAVPVVGCICLLTVVIFIIWLYKICSGRVKTKDRVSFIQLPNTRVGHVIADMRLDHLETSQLEPIFDAEAWNILMESNMLIAKDDLILLDIIGQGHFGCVYRGIVRSDTDKHELEVAVKTLKTLTDDSSMSMVEARKFLDEALRMREFDHVHVLQLIGLSLDKDDMPLVVLPFMRHGDLLSYIRSESNNPTVKDLMEFCIQIANGMAYLASLKFVHRDLAARNCMLDESMQVKVADFGLSRDIYERDYYSCDNRKSKLPVKWMALESLEKGIYNTKTDVWSYGVVLWEMMTRGVCPYPDVDNWDVIKFLKNGRRLPQPSYCPDSLYRTMLSCWHPVPGLRPSFEMLMSAVAGIIQEMEGLSNCIGPDVVYVNVPMTLDYLSPKTAANVEHERTMALSRRMTAV